MDGRYRPRFSSSRTARPVSWQVVTERGAVSRLEDPWRSMESRWQGGTPFQTFAWCSQWLEHRGKQYSPFILVSSDGAVIAPFATTTVGGMRVLRLIGTGDSDYLGLATSMPAAQAWRTVIAELHDRQGAWDLLHLHSIRQKDEVLSALQGQVSLTTIERDYEN